jgi:hypothetical protein
MKHLNDTDDELRWVCDDMHDLKQLICSGVAALIRSKSSGKRRTSGNQHKTRRQQFQDDFEAAKTAIKLGDLSTVRKMIKTKKQADWYDPERAWCLLDEAVKVGSSEIVEWLLDKGANPNTLFYKEKPYDIRKGICGGMYFSPFASAIEAKQDSIIRLLLAHGADLNLPVISYGGAGVGTCRDLAEEHGMLHCVEAQLISQAVGADGKDARNSKRL